jgi:hypothetical protein
MKIEDERGYLVIAQNNNDTDYVTCAQTLAQSIKLVEPEAKICLLTDVLVDNKIFDYVKIFPFGDQSKDSSWKLQNDWQCFYASPFRETIKLEADMIVPHSIKHWFDICSVKDVVCTIGARDFHNRKSRSRVYRKIFDDNNLPDVYNAITYWKLSAGAQKFFDTVRDLFGNWETAMSALKYGTGQILNTDLAYAIALRLLGEEQYTLPGSVPGLIHMKSSINGIELEDWTKELVWEIDRGSLRINTIEQMWPFHYHIKSFAKTIQEHYGRIS